MEKCSAAFYDKATTKYKFHCQLIQTNSHCVWQTIFRDSQLAEWIGHPQIPCIVKLPHALLVPTVRMYTLKIAEQTQTARLTPRHEIRTSSSFGLNMNIHTMPRFTSLGAVACVPARALMRRFDWLSIHRRRAHIVNRNIWPRVEHILCGVSQTSRALGRDTSDWTLLYWVSLLIEWHV